MQRREFLQGSLLLGATAMSPGMELAASPLAINVPPRTGLVLPPLNASDLSALLYELLRDAIRMENIELIKFFLEQGADVNETIKYCSPLGLAIGTASLEVVKFLVSQGADVNEIGIGGRTLLHEAVAYKRPLDVADIVNFFVSQGADVHAIDNDGETPLHQAARYSFLDAVKSLVSREPMSMREIITATHRSMNHVASIVRWRWWNISFCKVLMSMLKITMAERHWIAQWRRWTDGQIPKRVNSVARLLTYCKRQPVSMSQPRKPKWRRSPFRLPMRIRL